MKKKIMSMICLLMVLSTGIARFAQATHIPLPKVTTQVSKKTSLAKEETNSKPMLSQAKFQEAREACAKETKIPTLKKGEKPDPEQFEKFQTCMHERLAPEINRIRYQKK